MEVSSISSWVCTLVLWPWSSFHSIQSDKTTQKHRTVITWMYHKNIHDCSICFLSAAQKVLRKPLRTMASAKGVSGRIFDKDIMLRTLSTFFVESPSRACSRVVLSNNWRFLNQRLRLKSTLKKRSNNSPSQPRNYKQQTSSMRSILAPPEISLWTIVWWPPRAASCNADFPNFKKTGKINKSARTPLCTKGMIW